MAFHDDDVSTVPVNLGSHGLSSVPVELLLQIFKYASGNDIVSFLSTCKSYRPLVNNESIWFELCSRFGVRDLPSSGFHNHTAFFTVYSELLHTYGPLLGLWASDAPFQGRVIEFRLVLESKKVGWEGIVGEVWDFPRGVNSFLTIINPSGSPTNPRYREVLRIELLPPPASQLPTTHRLTRFGDDAFSPVQLFKPHNQVCYVLFRELQAGVIQEFASLHPIFPPPHSQWVDTDRGLPGLKQQHQPPLDESAHNRRGNLLYLPAPLGISVPTEHSLVLLRPIRGTITSSLIARTQLNYYPLRSITSVVADAHTWDPRTLVGIWLGSYSTHGTEVLYIVYDASSDWQLQAWKITGDTNVYRGALSWKAKVPFDHSGPRGISVTNHLVADMGIEEGSERASVRMFSGEGTVSSFGYQDGAVSHVPLVVAIVNQNEMRCRWSMDDYDTIVFVPRYTRYLGRDILSEDIVNAEPMIRMAAHPSESQ